MNSWVYNGFVIKSELLTETIRFYNVVIGGFIILTIL